MPADEIGEHRIEALRFVDEKRMPRRLEELHPGARPVGLEAFGLGGELRRHRVEQGLGESMGRVAPALARDAFAGKQRQALLERDAQRAVAQRKQFRLRLLRAEHCAHEPVDHGGAIAPEFILEPGDCGIARCRRRPLAHRAVHDHQRRQRRIAMVMDILQRFERTERPRHQHDGGVAGDELVDVLGTALGVEPLGRTVGPALATRIEGHDAMVRAQRLELPAPDRGRHRPARHEGDGRLPRARLARLDDVQAHAVGGGEIGAFKVHVRRVQRRDQGCKRCR